MKIIHALARYYPDNCGGIQVNLNELIPQLQSKGISIKIAAGQLGTEKENTYQLNNVEVYRYPVYPRPNSRAAEVHSAHGHLPHGKFDCFKKWLSTQEADIYHQHHWEVTCGLPHLRFAKQLGLKTVVTIHYPIPICQRTTLMLNGTIACDGKIDIVRCSRCTDTFTKNLPDTLVKTLSAIPMNILSQIPLPISAYLPASVDDKANGRFIRPVVVPAYVKARKKSLQEMAKYADRIIVVCDWLYEVMKINGIPEEKLILCRYGISYAAKALTHSHSDKIDTQNNAALQLKPEKLKVAFLGRWEASKGIDILVQAVKNLPPQVDIELVIYGISQDENYRSRCLQLIADDARIRIEKPLTREELPSVLSTYDLLAVPSQWLETGPLVVLESHSVGVPVIGSNLGGIAELVQHGVNGWLVTASDIPAWTEALSRLACDAEGKPVMGCRNLLNQLRQGIKPVRTVDAQAKDIVDIYKGLLA